MWKHEKCCQTGERLNPKVCFLQQELIQQHAVSSQHSLPNKPAIFMKGNKTHNTAKLVKHFLH